ncbi:MAG: transposase, partial [Clostridia bacterium]|nr:transposase [Clostridia bacterium]
KPPPTPFMVHASAILDAARFRHMRGVWRLALFLIMPDHIHLIVAVLPKTNEHPHAGPTVDRMVKQFKGAVTKRLGYSIWQRSFFDRVIRNPDDYDDCTKYIINNPIRYSYSRETGEK